MTFQAKKGQNKRLKCWTVMVFTWSNLGFHFSLQSLIAQIISLQWGDMRFAE
jgi:hypothetical protein